MSLIKNEKIYFRTIIGISIAIPLVVAILFFFSADIIKDKSVLAFLPKLNAGFNSLVAICLMAGFYFIKQKNIIKHRFFMLSAFSLSALFLISYVLYHLSTESTSFGGEGLIKGIYLFILLTHILLAIAIVPLVLITIYRSTSGQIEKHKKIARYTFPIWLYVAITGVIVYFMIAPYYNFN